eukprot:scaffold73345_cov17-Tisochrysis_lutea.AAC.1
MTLPARIQYKSGYGIVRQTGFKNFTVGFWASPALKQMGKGQSKLAEKDDDGVVHQMYMGVHMTPAEAKRHLESHCKKLGAMVW